MEVPKSLMEKSEEDEETLADLNLTHCRSQAKCHHIINIF